MSELPSSPAGLADAVAVHVMERDEHETRPPNYHGEVFHDDDTNTGTGGEQLPDNDPQNNTSNGDNDDSEKKKKKKKKEPLWKRVQMVMDVASGATEAYFKPGGQTGTATEAANKALGLASGHGGCCCCTCCATFSTTTVVAITAVVTAVIMSLAVVTPVAVTQCGCNRKDSSGGAQCKELAPPLPPSASNLPFYLNITGPNVAKADRAKANDALLAAVLGALALDDPAFSADNVKGRQVQQCKAPPRPGGGGGKPNRKAGATTAIFEGQLVPTAATSKAELEKGVMPDPTAGRAGAPSPSPPPRSSGGTTSASSANSNSLPSSPFASFVANQLVDVFPGATVCNSDRTGACLGEAYTVLEASSKCGAATCIAMDYSGSITDADAWPLEASFVDKIITAVSDPASMFAVLSFSGSDDYKMLIPLSARKDITPSALQQVRTSDAPPRTGTDLATPLEQCQTILSASTMTRKFIVLITDGMHEGRGDPIAAKNAATKAGIQIISVGVNGFNDYATSAAVDEKMLREIASGPDKVFIVNALGSTAQAAVPSILKSTCGT